MSRLPDKEEMLRVENELLRALLKKHNIEIPRVFESYLEAHEVGTGDMSEIITQFGVMEFANKVQTDLIIQLTFTLAEIKAEIEELKTKKRRNQYAKNTHNCPDL